jgi:hypothetical protein
VALVLLVLIALGITYAASRGSSASPLTTPLAQTHQTVDGIQCSGAEQLAYHIHQYVELYDHGKRVQLPADIGIPASPPGNEYNARCFYWLHVHAAYPNVIHVESPVAKTFTLGQFFDLWKASRTYTVPAGDAFVLKVRAAAARGALHVFLNGRQWTHDYARVPLKEHNVIAVEIGSPVVQPRPFAQWNGL